MNKRQLGGEKEALAAGYLQGRGYEVLERNYYCPAGEIDLIAKDGCCLVFIEVKYRRDGRYGLPEEAVTVKKRRTIYRAAQYYMKERHTGENRPCRFDVVAILGDQITLVSNAF